MIGKYFDNFLTELLFKSEFEEFQNFLALFKRISHSSPEDFPDFAEYFIRIIWSYFAEYANVGRAKLWALIDLRSRWLFSQNKSCQSKSCDRDLFLLRGLQVWPEAWKCISRINPRQTRPLRNEPLFSKEWIYGNLMQISLRKDSKSVKAKEKWTFSERKGKAISCVSW